MTSPEILRSAVGRDGEVCLPGDAGYDEAVAIWNGAIARRPSVVVRCASADAVSAAIGHARSSGLEVSVRGGGHNYSGNALTDGGLMIDLTPMKTITVDLGAKRARCGGGTTWGELDAATQEHGLAVTGGFISKTGVAGLTLGGGIGWLSRKIGLSCDNLVGAEIVTADGQIRRISADNEPDLFWAIRGGGGNFGVVTDFEFALAEVGPMLNLGLFLFKPEDGGDMMRFAREYVRTLPDDSSAFIGGMSAPPAPFVPEELHFTPAYGLVVVGFGSAEEHAGLIAPITATLKPIVEMVTPIPYVGLQTMFDESAPWGLNAYEKSIYVDDLSDAVIDVILEHQPKKMSPLSFVPVFILGGAYRRAAADSTAFGGDRGTGYLINLSGMAMSPDPAEYEAERGWVRDYWNALAPHASGTGGYVNFMAEQDGERVRSAYGDKYPRLQAIKASYDPDNVFHLNANIEPGS
jgi:FAD/FMN-containing dehydrogenase